VNACCRDHEAASACAERSPSVPRRPRMPASPCPVLTFKVAPTRWSLSRVAQRRAIGRAALSQTSGCSLPSASGPPASVRQYRRHPESSLAPGAVFEPDPDGLTGAVTRAASTMFGGLPTPRLEAARVCSVPSGAAAIVTAAAKLLPAAAPPPSPHLAVVADLPAVVAVNATSLVTVPGTTTSVLSLAAHSSLPTLRAGRWAGRSGGDAPASSLVITHGVSA
jgi:hypothetical protein